MNTRALFNKYQKHLVDFANSSVGHLFLKTENLPVVKLTPDSIHYLIGKSGKNLTIKSVFMPRSPYLKKFELALTSMEIANKSFDFIKSFDKSELIVSHFLGLDTTMALPRVMLLTGTFYPDPHPETTSVDGYVGRSGVNETFATIRAGAGNGFTDTSPTSNQTPYLGASTTSNQYNGLYRTIMLFDTSSLTSDAVISAATLSIDGNSKNNGLGSPDIHIAGAVTASNTTLSNSDFENVLRVSFGSVSYAGFSTAGYNDITLNASGIANINVSGISKFSAQLSWDINNSFTGAWSSSANSNVDFTLADTALTTTDPKLVVTYTLVPKGGSPIFFGNTAIA